MSIVMSLVVSSALLMGATAPAAPAKPKRTAAEIRALRAARIAADGGLVDRPVKGKVIRIKVDTDRISVAEVDAEVAKLRSLMRVAVEVVGRGEDPATKVGAFVTLAEQGEKVPALLCAPEDYWSTVNVTRLLAGEPDEATLKSRIVKELWRALAYALGAANSPQQPCVMRPISRAGDLDLHKVAALTPQPLMAMHGTINQLDFAKGGQVTYRRACEEGWAPAPTNDVQKAVWDKVHQMPKKPIGIEYDPKKGR